MSTSHLLECPSDRILVLRTVEPIQAKSLLLPSGGGGGFSTSSCNVRQEILAHLSYKLFVVASSVCAEEF